MCSDREVQLHVLRIVGTEVPKPEQLGVPQSVIDLYDKKRGLVLVTGPTGSGKSTTLASLIDRINDERNAYVITLEDLSVSSYT